MVRLKAWQWIVLGLPITAIAGFLLAAAGVQIHQWGINWIWAIILLVFVGWRWLLAKWLRPTVGSIESAMAGLAAEPEAPSKEPATNLTQQAQAELQKVLQAAREDVLPWEDWTLFFHRCQNLIRAIAQVYYPQAKRPLLNIYIPQSYALLRGTVDDVDRWMQRLSPALNQITIGQAYEAYEVYQKLEPATRTALKIWNWSQWVWNPAAALAKTATQRYSTTANQQLLVNLGQIFREEVLKALGMRAIALYSGEQLQTLTAPATLPSTKTQTLRDILSQSKDSAALEQEPVRILLAGRTGAGKSSLINTLFACDMAAVDVLPSTDRFQDYRLKSDSGETLILWDVPGYEQINHPELRTQVLEQLAEADALLLVAPATDPALQMDLDFLSEVKAESADLPAIAVITQVDRLRPIREWQPPYDWRQGERPKEGSIREAVQYRVELLGDSCQAILPLVTGDISKGRESWGVEALSEVLLDTIAPAKQFRLARFLQDLAARTTTAAKIIEQYASQMSTTQGLTSLLKSPVLNFVSTLMTGSSALAVLLAEKIPVEQSPLLLGKLQMAYELFSLLAPNQDTPRNFDLPVLWPLLSENSATPAHDAWAFGHALVEYWTQSLSPAQLQDRYRYYLAQANT